MRKKTLAAGLILAALTIGILPAMADHSDGGTDETWIASMNSTDYWEDRFGGPGLEVTCDQYTSHSGFIGAQYDAAVVKDGTMVRVYDKAGPYTALGPVNPATSEHFDAPHSWVMKCQITEIDYCDPANKPGGTSIGDWVPDDVDCVDFTWETTCGSLSFAIENDVVGINYAVAVETAAATYNLGNATFTSPVTFPEDHNGGSIDLALYIVGGESDYVTGRDIPNFWEQNALVVTVDTDCEEPPTTTTIPEETTTTVPETTTTQPETTTTLPETTTTVPEETTTSSPEETTTTEAATSETLPFTGPGSPGLVGLGISLAALGALALTTAAVLRRKENI